MSLQMISMPSRSSSFVDLLGPPMEASGGADETGLLLEGRTAGELGVFAVLDHGKVLPDPFYGHRQRIRITPWRGLATRYEQRAGNYRAMVVIASIAIWLQS